MPICDIDADVKPWLNIEIAETKHDTTLAIIRDSIEKSVLNYTEACFTQKTEQHIYDGNGSDTITPSEGPIVSVSEVKFNVALDGTGGDVIDAASYYLPKDMEEVDTYDGTGTKGSSAILLRGHKSPRYRGALSVTFTFGYDGVPPDVKHAILMAIEADFRRKGRKSIGAGSRSKKDESERLTDSKSAWDKKTGLPQEVVYKLNPYRVFEFPSQPMATYNT